VLRAAVSVLPHMHSSLVMEQQYILLCFAKYVFLILSHSPCFTGLLSVLQRCFDNSGDSFKVTYRLRRCFTSQYDIYQNMKDHAAFILTVEDTNVEIHHIYSLLQLQMLKLCHHSVLHAASHS
jgi:hypothetical protein